MNYRLSYAILITLITTLIIPTGLKAQVVWSGGGNDARWSTAANWRDNTPPDDPYNGTIRFGDAGSTITNLLDFDLTTRDLVYTNAAGFLQCFDDIAFPVTNDYATRTNHNWIAAKCKITDNSGAQLSPTGGYVRTPFVPTGIAKLRFEYRNTTGKEGPTGTCQLQVSTDNENWQQLETFATALNTTWISFATNLNESACHYVRVINNSDYGVDLHRFEVTWLVPTLQVTDLGGHRLTIDGGYLGVGDNGSRLGQINHTHAAIINGTLQLGSATSQADIRVGYTDSLLDQYAERRGKRLCFSGLLDTIGLRRLDVGVVDYSNHQIDEGWLDLSSTTIKSGVRLNTLTATRLAVGAAPSVLTSSSHGFGELLLPASLQQLTVDQLIVGCDGTGMSESQSSSGRIDFGHNSQLTNLTVGSFLNLGSGGFCLLDNMPAERDVIIGSPEAPGRCWLGAGGSRYSRIFQGLGAELAVSNANFSAWLDQLYIGVAMDYTEGHAITGALDLAHATVQIGDTPNRVAVPDLRIGGHTYMHANNPSKCDGVLRLPPAITSLQCGIFQLGANSAAFGILDFGTDSQLTHFQVTNSFYYGYAGGKAYLSGLPTKGLLFEIGTSEHPANEIYIGVTQKKSNYSENTYEGEADLELDNATFKAYVLELGVGNSAYEQTSNNGDAVGNLILTNSTLAAFEVYGDVTIGRSSTVSTYKRATGRVRLPQGTMNIGGDLHLGGQRSGTAPAAGLLDLHGTTVRVAGNCDIWETGLIATRLQGNSAGLELLTAHPTTLSISNNATINLSFEALPQERNADYYGLRWTGDHVAQLETLCADNTIIWSAPGLPPAVADRIGVWYNPIRDYTFVGIPGVPQGTKLLLR